MRLTGERIPAVAGGHPVRSEPLPFARAAFDEREEAAALRVLRSGWLTTGVETEAFERELADSLMTPHVVAVNSCTAALHLAFELLERQGGTVVTTPLTFASCIAAILYTRRTPLLVDVDPIDLTIDIERVAAALDEDTVAVLGVDYAGQPIRVSELAEVTARRGIDLVEDAAHSLGARVGDAPVGNLADTTCFSFYATKNITTGEGGALATRHEDRARRARELRLHGMSADAWRRYLPGGGAFYDIVRIGFKYNLSDLAAAIGREQLRKEPQLRAARRRTALAYRDALADLEPLVRLPIERAGTSHAWHLFPLRLELTRLRIGRADFIEAMRAEGISCSAHFTPVHDLTAYRSLPRCGPLTNAEAAGRSEVSLPIWPGMTDGDAQDVVTAVRKLVTYYRAA